MTDEEWKEFDQRDIADKRPYAIVIGLLVTLLGLCWMGE